MDLKYGKVNVYKMVLDFVDQDAEYELRGIFDALESAILASDKRISELDGLGYEAQSEIDEECGYLEDILGSAFVMMQRYITRVASWMGKLSKRVKKETGRDWALPTTLPDLRKHFLASCGPSVAGGSIRFAAAANSGANFFKHSSEWEGEWSRLKDKRSRRTFADVEKLGVKQSSTGNHRAIAKGLGLSDYSNFRPFCEGLDGWRIEVLGVVRAELVGLGLV